VRFFCISRTPALREQMVNIAMADLSWMSDEFSAKGIDPDALGQETVDKVICSDEEVAAVVRKRRPDLAKHIKILATGVAVTQAMANVSAELTVEFT
jgi:hypothetical protein